MSYSVFILRLSPFILPSTFYCSGGTARLFHVLNICCYTTPFCEEGALVTCHIPCVVRSSYGETFWRHCIIIIVSILLRTGYVYCGKEHVLAKEEAGRRAAEGRRARKKKKAGWWWRYNVVSLIFSARCTAIL